MGVRFLRGGARADDELALTPSRDTIRQAEQLLTAAEFRVWLAKHVLGLGRRSGSMALGISEDAFRYRLARADRKLLEVSVLRVAS
jgi:hypothetical protein